MDRTKRTKRNTKRQNLLTLLTLKFRRVHNSLSFWHSHFRSLCSFSKFSISRLSTVFDGDNSVSSVVSQPLVSQPLSQGSHGKCNLCCPIPSHSMVHFPWESHSHGQAWLQFKLLKYRYRLQSSYISRLKR